MTTENLITFGAAILAFLASVIAAVVSIYNARFTRFAKERWWERKADAYARIIDALSSLTYYYEEHLDAVIEGRDVPESRRTEIGKHWNHGYGEVKRATAAGAFLISGDAEESLTAFWKEKDKGVDPDDWFGMIESHYGAARSSLRSIVAAAKKDLAV
jgi:hypothetical protein